MRFVFSPPAEAAADLLTLPWETPLSQWTDDRIVEIPQHGRSRHVVRFVAEAGGVFALKELCRRRRGGPPAGRLRVRPPPRPGARPARGWSVEPHPPQPGRTHGDGCRRARGPAWRGTDPYHAAR
jgi:hypothetical protein